MLNISVKTKFNELKITKLNYCKNLLKNKNNRGKTVNFLNNYKQSSLRNFRTKNLCFFLCELRLRSCSLICIFNFTFFVLQIEPFFSQLDDYYIELFILKHIIHIKQVLI